MRVAILYDGPSCAGSAPDLLILDSVEAVAAALEERGDEALPIPVFRDTRWIEALTRSGVDLVFNLCEGIDGLAEAEPAVISVLELLGIRYTGPSSWTTAVCLRKHVVNALLHRSGLPIPEWALARRGEAVPDVAYPAICKPAAEDASLGVEQRSVVSDRAELEAQLDEMHGKWRDVVVQRFIDGREMNVGVLGDRVLPVSEIVFDELPPEMWRIVSFKAKWETGSKEDLGTIPQCPARIRPQLRNLLQSLARSAWEAVGGSGFARVDFRVDAKGRPWILELNANPDIAHDAGLAGMAQAAGLDYTALISAICDEALKRPASASGSWPAVVPAEPEREPRRAVAGDRR